MDSAQDRGHSVPMDGFVYCTIPQKSLLQPRFALCLTVLESKRSEKAFVFTDMQCYYPHIKKHTKRAKPV
jgi:hypothetical protein